MNAVYFFLGLSVWLFCIYLIIEAIRVPNKSLKEKIFIFFLIACDIVTVIVPTISPDENIVAIAATCCINGSVFIRFAIICKASDCGQYKNWLLYQFCKKIFSKIAGK